MENIVSKGHLPVIARVDQGLTALEILSASNGEYVAIVYAGVNELMQLTREQLVSLRDQINTWIEAMAQ